MSRTVHCQKLGKDLPGLEHPPIDNDLGRRIYDGISQEAWKLWLGHSTMVINEYRMNLGDESGRETLKQHMRSFLKIGEQIDTSLVQEKYKPEQ